jgi:hypothetical protein
MSEATRRLSLLAERASAGGRKVSPIRVAAQILAEALAGMSERRRALTTTADDTGVDSM